MIGWSDIKMLQKQKNDLQIQLDEFLNSDNKDINILNQLKSKLLILDTCVKKILSLSEVELKQNEKNKKGYFELKDKTKKISKIKIASEKMLEIVELYMAQNNVIPAEHVQKNANKVL